MSNTDVMKPQHTGRWHFIWAERLFPYPASLLHLHLPSPPPCMARLFYKIPAGSLPTLSEGHATTLSSPPPGTSCTFFKHTALQKEQRGRSPGPTAGAEDARVNDSLQRPRPAAEPCNWQAEGQSSAPTPQRQPKRSLLVLSLSAQEEPQTDDGNEMSALSTTLNKCRTSLLV